MGIRGRQVWRAPYANDPRVAAMLQFLVQANQKHAMSCDRKFWCHAHAKAKASAGHAHTTKALAVPPALAAMGYEPANGGWQLRPGTSFSMLKQLQHDLTRH